MFTEHEKGKGIDEIMHDAGHDFQVELAPIKLNDTYVIPDKQAVVTDRGAYLGTVGMDTFPMQPDRFYEMMQGLAENTNGFIAKTFSMHGGSTLGAVVQIDSFETVKGDEIQMNMVGITSYASRFALAAKAISHRMFCTNQLPSSASLVSIKQTKNSADRLDARLKMVAFYGKEINQFKTNMQLLAHHKMSENESAEWFRGLFPVPHKDSQRALTTLDNNTSSFVNLWNDGQGADVPGVRGTAYGTLNALTEWVNHYRPTRVAKGKDEDQVRFESLAFGSGDSLMQKGMQSLLQIAA